MFCVYKKVQRVLIAFKASICRNLYIYPLFWACFKWAVMAECRFRRPGASQTGNVSAIRFLDPDFYCTPLEFIVYLLPFKSYLCFSFGWKSIGAEKFGVFGDFGPLPWFASRPNPTMHFPTSDGVFEPLGIQISWPVRYVCSHEVEP